MLFRSPGVDFFVNLNTLHTLGVECCDLPVISLYKAYEPFGIVEIMGMPVPMDATDFPDVTYTVLAGGRLKSSILEVKKASTSFLLSGSRRKSIQLPGSLVSPDTFLRTPLPLFSRVDSCKLSGTYVSHTTPSLVAS